MTSDERVAPPGLNWPHEMEWVVGTEAWVEQDVLFPFALDELLCRRFGAGGRAAVHVWTHPSALILGLRDRKLPQAEAAMASFRAAGRAVAVRNSGGAAVPLDGGVANVSLLLPLPERSRDFRDDFAYMAELIATAAEPWVGTVAAGEISGAYCPGDYDLSIGGRKFCGISQRRQASGFAVQAFVNVEGAGEERAQLAASFYRIAGSGGQTAGHPIVEAGRTVSLAERAEAGQPPSCMQFAGSLRRVLQSWGIRLIEKTLDESELEETLAITAQLRTRYDR